MAVKWRRPKWLTSSTKSAVRRLARVAWFFRAPSDDILLIKVNYWLNP
ncbi:MAG TPA: hypothetical protein VMM12_03600 [Longimicrobiales bacterium]|nr:hypothetical protein [Longimicrobiales bacterium]